jgi:phenylalanyl-tRNA synthetase beta chain
MRQTLLFGGLEVIAYNKNRQVSDLKIYEFGNVYLKLAGKEGLEKYREQQQLALFTTGKIQDENWNTGEEDADFYYLKGVTENILRRLGVDPDTLEIKETKLPLYKESLSYFKGETKLAEVSSVAAKVLEYFDIREDVYTSNILWEELLRLIPVKDMTYKPVSKFPAVRRDLALLVNADVKFEDLKRTAMKTERKLLKSVGIFDVYEGDKIPGGKKSYALSFTLQAEEKTLTDKVIDKTMSRIQQVLKQEYQAEIR